MLEGKNFPTLYKKSSKGKIQVWNISVIPNHEHSTAFDIFIEHGQQDGKMQTTVDTIFEGKNIGKANETTPYEQAVSEAESKWKKQIERKGYVQNIEDVDKDLRPGIEPMLAHRYDKYPEKMNFPCYIQPKLDGHRCIAIIDGEKCTLFSRQRVEITGVPHINEALFQRFGASSRETRRRLVLDGELYNHDYKDRFEELTGFIRSETPKDGYEAVQYHIYDMVDGKGSSFTDRYSALRSMKLVLDATKSNGYIHIVETHLVSQHEVVISFRDFLKQGYEGAILRDPNTPYEHKRSYGLQKVKEFEDSEFLITGIKEGRGKMKGHAIFECQVDNASIGTTFDVKMKGSEDRLKEIFENQESYLGKLLTVQYQGLTKNGIPRFPVGLRVREEA